MGKTEKYHILDREMGKTKYLLRTRNWEDEEQGMGNGVLEAGDGKYK